MPEPTNKKLYEEVKKEIYAKYPKHSAYRSGLLVQEYKKRGGGYSGDKSKGSLGRWFKEEWSTQDGSKTYQKNQTCSDQPSALALKRQQPSKN